MMRSYWILAAVLLLSAASLFSQAVTGSLVGTVMDSSGATVPGARVTITETTTGLARNMLTNESGNYSFPALEPGTYRVAVEREGFRTAIREGVNVLVNTSIRADMTLEPGQISETVTVTADTAVLQTDRADTGRKIESEQLANLPLGPGRNFHTLLNLVPGTTRSFQPHSEFFNSQGSMANQTNGVSRLGNNLQFEGVDNNQRAGLLSVLIPPIEALQTVDVSTGNYEAELGRAGGAVTNLILKSGTNDLHGGLYWFNNTSAVNARETFQPRKPVTTYNYYGFNLGGPIIKNRTFFFGDYLRVNDRRGDGYIITVPGAAFRSGDFSSQPKYTVYDPDTGNLGTGAGRTPFANNQIPNARFSPITAKLLGFVPLPNLGSGLTNNYASQTTRKKDTDSFDIKVDHAQSDKDRFSVRYSFQRPVVVDPGRFGIYGGGGKGFAATGVNRTQSAAINYTRLFSPTFFLELRAGLSRFSNIATNLDSGTNASEEIGIKGVNVDNWSSGISSMNVGGYPNPLIGYAASLPWNRAETTFAYVGNFTKIVSNHTVKWGADLRREREELLQTQNAGGPRGEFQFRNFQTSVPGAAVLDQVNSLASFILDVPTVVRRDLSVQFPTNRLWMLYTYIQDKWQVSPKLTLDLGIRHDYLPPNRPRLKGGWSNYDPSTNTYRVAGYGDIPMDLGRKNYYTNFAPRIGFAYRIDPKTVMRGGFGMSWVPFPDNKLAWDDYPVKQTNSFQSLTSYGRAQTATGAIASMATGFPPPLIVSIPSNGLIKADTPLLLAQNVNSVIPLDYHEGYVESWNFAVQRQLPKNFTIEAAYVGNHTVRAPVTYNLNAGMIFNAGSNGKPLYAAFGKNADVFMRYAGYSNNYNSLQVKADRRFAGGFMLTTAYTYGKALGYSSEDGNLWNYIQPRRSYARLDFDRRHTFVQSYVWQLPFGRGRKFLNEGPAAWILGDWQVNGILTFMSGLPMTLGTSVSPNTPGSSLTADQVGSFKVSHGIAGPSGTDLWFDTSAFKQPLDADGKTPHWGSMGRNNLTGPGLADLDLSLFRTIQIREQMKLEVRAETTNFTNTPAFANPNTTLGSATFGRVTGTLSKLGNGGTGARTVQFGLRLSF